MITKKDKNSKHICISRQTDNFSVLTPNRLNRFNLLCGIIGTKNNLI